MDSEHPKSRVNAFSITEESRRSLTMAKSSVSSDDFVAIDVRVTSVDTTQGPLYERVRLVPMCRFARDKTTPATDLRLLINSAVMYRPGSL